MKILLIEDNDAITMGLEYLLTQEGYGLSTAQNKKDADALLQKEVFDLILLDISLPDGNGFQLCEQIKKEQDIPIIFLTAKEEEKDVVKGFDLGADDYIIKPFRNRELISRIKNSLRRRGKLNEVLCCGHIKVDMLKGKVYCHEEEVPMTKLEYKILSIMMSHPGKLFTRQEILEDIWDISGNFVNDNTLSVTIKRIREKVDDKEGKVIKTIRGMGYRIEKD